MLIVHVCSLWYSHSVKVNYWFIVFGICYDFVTIQAIIHLAEPSQRQTTINVCKTRGCNYSF